MNRRAWSLLLLLAAIWGASYLLIKIGIRDLSPLMVAWSRIALGALVLIPVAMAQGALAGLRPHLGTLAFLGVVQVAGPFVLIAAGEEEISSSLAGILVAAAPLFTALLAIRVDHEERAEGARLVGVMLGLIGVAVLLGLDLGGSGGELLGGLAVVVAALGYAIGGFAVKHRLRAVQPLGVATAVLAVAALELLPLAALSLPDSGPALGPLAAVFALGAFGTGVAFVIFYDLIAGVGPARAFTVTYLAPGFAVVYGAVLLDEAVTLATVAGLILIVGGSYLAAEGRLPRRLASRRPRRQPRAPAAAARRSEGAAR